MSSFGIYLMCSSIETKEGKFFMNENQSLSHTKWSYKPYIVFAQKFRRKEIYLKMKDDRGKILRQCCDQKKVRS